jgi:hypothetical protein
MAESVRKPNKPNDPPYGGGEDETPRRDNPPEPGQDVKEPPLPGTVGLEEKFPRKGEI